MKRYVRPKIVLDSRKDTDGVSDLFSHKAHNQQCSESPVEKGSHSQRKNTGLLLRRKTWFTAIRISCHADSPEAHDPMICPACKSENNYD
jgi:hypothetical protein